MTPILNQAERALDIFRAASNILHETAVCLFYYIMALWGWWILNFTDTPRKHAMRVIFMSVNLKEVEPTYEEEPFFEDERSLSLSASHTSPCLDITKYLISMQLQVILRKAV